MIHSKYLYPLTAVLLAAITLLCYLALSAAVEDTSATAAASRAQYETSVFGGGMMELNILVNEDAWQTMLDNATAESYICVDVVVNGTAFSSVGLRAKGNSSLTTVAGSDSDRYSFKLKFDEYVKGQTCFGLDSFVVNNIHQDATYMKEYLSYEIMKFAGVPTPLTNYVNIQVNSQNWGCYLAIESYGESFVSRMFGTDQETSSLYNVKNQGDLKAEDADGQEPAGGGGMGNATGGDLIYTDDSITSYSAIFGNAVFNSTTQEDYQKVIAALRNLASSTDLETYFHVDEILRYFAAHTFVVNLDSYISSMKQNFYLYESGGQITVLPWDYNLAFGGFQSGTASAAVNFPIDTPVSGVELSQRPLLAKLLEVEEYQEKYHQYLSGIVTGYFDSGLFEAAVAQTDALIGSYVQQDATAFYTYDQYQTAQENLLAFGLKRAESVKGQLAGAIPSTTAGQNADPSALTDASGIDLSAMGSQGGGGGMMAMGRPDQDGGFPGGLEGGMENGAPPDGGGQRGSPPGMAQQGSMGSRDLDASKGPGNEAGAQSQSGSALPNILLALGATFLMAVTILIVWKYQRNY